MSWQIVIFILALDAAVIGAYCGVAYLLYLAIGMPQPVQFRHAAIAFCLTGIWGIWATNHWLPA